MKRKIFFICICVIFLLHISLSAQEPYKVLPKEVIDIVDAPPTPQASISPAVSSAYRIT